MLTITIDGNRGEGRTTVSRVIAKKLKKLGFIIEYEGNRHDANRIKEELRTVKRKPKAGILRGYRVKVVDCQGEKSGLGASIKETT